MIKYIFLFTLLLGNHLLVVLPEDKRLNILLINVDDMGWSDVGFMGSEVYHTPNID